MTNNLTTIFTQAGLRRDADGWYQADALLIPSAIPLGGGLNLTHMFGATDLQKLIAREVAQLDSLGFIQKPKIYCSYGFARISFYSAISAAYSAKLYLFTNSTFITAKCIGYYSGNIMDFVRTEKEYMRQLAAAKNHRAVIVAVVFECLPQPIAEEIVLDVSLCET